MPHYTVQMTRLLRLEFAGALYHETFPERSEKQRRGNTDVRSDPWDFFLRLFSLCGYIAASSGLTLAGETRMSTRTTVGDLDWTKLPNGRLVSPVLGHMKTDKHITFIKFAPGMKTTSHTHSNDYVGIVVEGTARHYQPGFPETETMLPAGSHWAMSADVVHISEYPPSSECVFAIYQDAEFDIKPVK